MNLYGLSFCNGGSNAPGSFFVSSTNPEATVAVGMAKIPGVKDLHRAGTWHSRADGLSGMTNPPGIFKETPGGRFPCGCR